MTYSGETESRKLHQLLALEVVLKLAVVFVVMLLQSSKTGTPVVSRPSTTLLISIMLASSRSKETF